MRRALLQALLRVLLRVFFRRIEVAGRPPDGPAVYALNHPNALVDPIFILCLAPQPVSFLAKEPVFRMPLIGGFVRAFDSLPVYRRQDGADPADNRRTLDAAGAILERGGAIALFPEGTSHSDPRLRPLKTGAARIALAAGARRAADRPPVPVVPVGLHYSAKGRFRSQALVSFGAPLEVARVALDDQLEPPAEAVAALTASIEAALDELTLQADTARAMELATRADRLYRAADPTAEPGGATEMADALARRRRFVAGHARLERERPELLARLIARMTRYETTLTALGLDVRHPAPAEPRGWRALRAAIVDLAAVAALALPALLGAAVHAPAYQLIRLLAFRLGAEPDRRATIKLIGGLLLFPLSWLLVAAALGWQAGSIGAALGFLAAPACGGAALLVGPRIARLGAALRGATVLATRRRLLGYLANERAAIRAELAALGAELDASADRAG